MSEARGGASIERAEAAFDPWDADSITAQDVIDAIRVVLQAQKDGVEATAVINHLLDFAPDSLDDRGIQLLVRLIVEGSLKVELS